MKKFLKRLGILLLLGAMVFALCGCRALDEMRAQQLFLEEDGSFYKDGFRYVPLVANDYFCPEFDFSNNYYLTEKDVPVLLSAQFHTGYLEFSADGLFCQNHRTGGWYCRESVYEDVQARNRAPFVPEILFYNYYTYDAKGEYQDIIYTLSPEEVAALRAVISGEPLQLGDGMYITYDWEMGLTEATKDLLFCYSGPTVCKAGNTLYVNTYGEDGSKTYQVPEAYNAILESMAKCYLDAFYYEDYDDVFAPTEPEVVSEIAF